MQAVDSHRRIINIPNFPDVAEFVATTLRGQITSVASHAKPRLAANCDTFNTTEIWGCSYHAPISLKFEESDYFRVQLQQRGQGVTRLGRQEFPVTSDQAVISSAAAELHFGEGFKQKALRINRTGLTKKLATLLDTPLISSLAFETSIDCRAPRFDLFLRELRRMEELTLFPHEHIPPFLFAELEQSLYSVMLGALPHNYSAYFERHVPSAAPWQVRCVEEYIRAHWDHPIMIEDIVGIVGCSARSIFRTFRENRGYTPMEFVRHVRLLHARKMLLDRQDKSVTRIALACGFSDLGRFSKEYACVYGELPSQTFKRSRAASFS